MNYVTPKSVKVLSFDWDNLEQEDNVTILDAAIKNACLIPHRGDRRNVIDRLYAIKKNLEVAQ